MIFTGLKKHRKSRLKRKLEAREKEVASLRELLAQKDEEISDESKEVMACRSSTKSRVPHADSSVLDKEANLSDYEVRLLTPAYFTQESTDSKIVYAILVSMTAFVTYVGMERAWILFVPFILIILMVAGMNIRRSISLKKVEAVMQKRHAKKELRDALRKGLKPKKIRGELLEISLSEPHFKKL